MRHFLIFILLLNFGTVPKLFAATNGAEARAFKSARQLLDTKLYGLAEMNFARFVEEHPASARRAEAILHQAEARYFQTNYSGALELLQDGIAQAGPLAHEYQYLIAQTFFAKGNFRSAADAYAELNKSFPQSAHALEASYDEALSESKLDHWPRVVDLLETPDGKFQSLAKTQPNSGFVLDGYLLLAEAFLKLSRFDDGEKALAQLDGRVATPTTKWRQNFLLCRLQLAAGRATDALAASTNLIAAAQESANRRLTAESFFLRGEILEKLKRLPEALATYEQNFTNDAPAEIRRQAFLKTVDLDLAEGRVTNAVLRLENFITQNPADSALDLARLTLGELQLKQHVAQTKSATAASNLFEQAFSNFNLVITNFPESAHLGRAFLDRGWCFWLQENIPAAESDFSEAARRLPVSQDRAVARFKLADAQFRLTNYTAAVTNYQTLIRNYTDMGPVTNSLFEPALYQTMRASMEIGNTGAATDAMNKLLDWFPHGSLGDRSVLLVGGNLTRIHQESEARELFLNYLQRVTNSPRAAEIKLAIAQTFVHEKNWVEALSHFDSWVTNFATNPLLPEGEYSRALAYAKADMVTNAFLAFTNFVARFPTNHLAALAQNWVADFYWNHEDYRSAEKNYQELYQKFNPAPELGYQARLMAGRSAYDRSDYSEAAKYFGALITLLEADTNSPLSLKGEAYFALGDTYFQDFLSNTNSDLSQAITALTRVTTKEFSTNALAARAWGRIGDCYFQWAGLDPSQSETRYKRAMESYGMVINSPLAAVADVAARSAAEVGIGHICEKAALGKSKTHQKLWMDAALLHYMNVVTEVILRDGESSDAKWMYEAGIAAAKICESSEKWDSALEIYKKLAERLPPMRPALEKKMAQLRSHLETAKSQGGS